MWDVNTSFNLINDSFDKLGLDYFLDRNLYSTAVKPVSTSFTSDSPTSSTYSDISTSTSSFSNISNPSSTSYSGVSTVGSTTWSTA